MTLSTQDVEATGLTYLVSFFLRLLTNTLNLSVPRLFVLFRSFHRVQTTRAQIQVSDDVRVTAQHDVSTTTGHVSCHGNASETTRHCDNLSFLLVVLSVQHRVRNTFALQELGKVLGLLN